MSATPAAPPPVSPLARYRLLSPSAAVKVSPLCLGTMNFGAAWKEQMGAYDQCEVETILDFYYEQGGLSPVTCSPRNRAEIDTGNFVDTSNNYQFQESEQIIGEWMRKKGVRDQMVIATKYTTNFMAGPAHPSIMANYSGNGAKSLRASLEASLRNLQTDYIDLWDYSTSIPELMQSLNQLVISGKVLYLGVSNTPAWVVSKANEYARNHGLRQFSVYQGQWSASCRDFERDIIPMCKSEGMGIVPWGSLGRGRFKTSEQREIEQSQNLHFTETEIKVCQALEPLAFRFDTTLPSIALAYIIAKAPYVFPVVGGRGVSQLQEYIQALTTRLLPEDINTIESAAPFDLGFPHSMLWDQAVPDNPQDIRFLSMAGTFDFVPEPKPIMASWTGK